jgi:probable HAF family extracellular repeat protein
VSTDGDDAIKEDEMMSTRAKWCGTQALLAVLASFPLLVLPATAHAQPVSIGTLGGDNSNGTAINASGQVVGWSDLATQEQHAFLWTPTAPNGTTGTMVDLGHLGGVYSDAWGINHVGQVVGLTNMPSDGDRAYLWTPTTPNGITGTMVSIGTLGGWSSQGYGINNSGQVVGWSYWTLDPTDGHDNETHAFLWTPTVPNGSAGAMIDLGTLGGTDSQARGISAEGKVVGFASTADGAMHAFLWTPGGTSGPASNPQMQDLGTLPDQASSGAFAVNSAGQVTGFVNFVSGAEHAFLWTPGGTAGPATNPQMEDLGTLGGIASIGTGLTETGAVSGASYLTGDAGAGYDAVIWVPQGANNTSGNWVDAGSLDNVAQTIAWGINASGQVAGWGAVGGGCCTNAFVTAPIGNLAPSASDESISVQQNKSAIVTLTASDPDNDPLTYIILTNPAHGTLTGSGASRTYTPAHGYMGPDSFTFKVNDGQADSNVATVTISVRAPNRAPLAKADAVSLLANQSSITINVLANDSDPDQDPLTITAVAAGKLGTTAIVMVGGAQQVQYAAPAQRPKKASKDSFTYTISDGRGGTATGTVTVTYK